MKEGRKEGREEGRSGGVEVDYRSKWSEEVEEEKELIVDGYGLTGLRSGVEWSGVK